MPRPPEEEAAPQPEAMPTSMNHIVAQKWHNRISEKCQKTIRFSTDRMGEQSWPQGIESRLAFVRPVGRRHHLARGTHCRGSSASWPPKSPPGVPSRGVGATWQGDERGTGWRRLSPPAGHLEFSLFSFSPCGVHGLDGGHGVRRSAPNLRSRLMQKQITSQLVTLG